jgi:xanthine dehydrogenase accessory factor
MREGGAVVGSVSGGCVEEDLVERMRAGEFPDRPRFVAYGETREEAQRLRLPCGGGLRLLVERPALESLRELAARLAGGERVQRRVDLASGAWALAPAAPGASVRVEAGWVAFCHGPRLRLLVIGAGQISRFLADMALALEYEVTVCDPREEYADLWQVAAARLSRSMPDDAVRELVPDGSTAVVALTHDPRLDDLALLEALNSPAFYVGALGSSRSNARRRERLRQFDLSEAQIGRLRGPVGFPIGSRTPPEIAVAIAAEMTAAKNGVLPAHAAVAAPAGGGCTA